jgi:hypothetical protein
MSYPDFVNGLKSLSGLRILTAEQSDFVHDAAEAMEAVVGALARLDSLLDFSDDDVSQTWIFEDTTAIQEAFQEARSALAAYRSSSK